MDELKNSPSEKSGERISAKTVRTELFSGFFLFCLFLTLICALLYVAARLSSDFAEFFSRYPAAYIRAVLGTITSLIPFSIAEMLLIFSPVLAISYIIWSSAALKRDDSFKIFIRQIKIPVCAVLLVLSLFVLTFSTAYFRNPLDQTLGIEKKEVSAAELEATANIINKKIVELEKSIDFVYAGSSIMPYSYDVMVDKLNEAYTEYCFGKDFIKNFSSKPKPIVLSKPMTYTQIAGVYTFFTGEANININYPDYILPYTTAHEMAHQRGIAREEEANLLAFLVSIESTDAYIQYSAYLNVQEYILDALRKADKDAYNKFMAKVSGQVMGELRAYSTFYNQYKNKTVQQITSTVNNSFLQSQGQTQGIKSYGLVVDAVVAYFHD